MQVGKLYSLYTKLYKTKEFCYHVLDEVSHDAAEVAQTLLHDLLAVVRHDAVRAAALYLGLSPLDQSMYIKRNQRKSTKS